MHVNVLLNNCKQNIRDCHSWLARQYKETSGYDQEMPQSHTEYQPIAWRGGRKISNSLMTPKIQWSKAASSSFPSDIIAKLESTKNM